MGQITKNSIKNTFHKTLKHSCFKITRGYTIRFLNLNSCFKTDLMKLVFLILTVLAVFHSSILIEYLFFRVSLSMDV
jgi:hypothetical protein